jgi:hypothetical protein
VELEVTWGRAVRVWWAYLWRNLIAIAVAFVLAVLVGAIFGFILGAAGVSLKTIQIVTMPIGFALGLIISVIPMKLILGKDFGEFRLLLVPKQ